jgi:DNA-binding beta-propeller fold protein YncE
MRFTILLVSALALSSLPPAAFSATPFPLRTTADVPLSGNTSRMDYESIDAGAHLLFVAHMGAGEVIAFDTLHRRVVATIGGIPTVRGVLAVPSPRRVYAAAQGTGEIVAIDERSLGITARVRKAGDVDGLAFDPSTNRLFVSDEGGGNDVVIDTRNNRLIARVALGGEAGNTQYDAASKHIFVAVQTRDELAEIDPRSLVLLGRYNLPGCNHGHGVAIDASRRTAYIACEGNDALVKFDLRSHRVVDRANVGGGPDVLAIDPVLRRLYVASESGIVSIFDIGGARLVKLGEVLFAPHAHVVAVDPFTHEVFFALQDIGGRPVLRIAVPR